MKLLEKNLQKASKRLAEGLHLACERLDEDGATEAWLAFKIIFRLASC